MSGINRKMVIRNVHPVTTPKASGLNQNNISYSNIINKIYKNNFNNNKELKSSKNKCYKLYVSKYLIYSIQI